MGLVALQSVGSSWARERTCLLCAGGWIPNHWTTREAPQKICLSPKPSSYETLFGNRNRVFADIIKLSWDHTGWGWVLHLVTPVIREVLETEETKGIGSCGDWSDATTNQGMPGATKAVWGRKGFFPRTFRASRVLITPVGFGLSSLHNCERRTKYQTWWLIKILGGLSFVVFCYGWSRK